ncbi:pentatricopeptide repeat-containing protein At1g02370, mitochondrial isoform X1 [Coffea arabica]|uniref:Pentatricopeptide repeat-containing protein At1g02370, mitochondrial isoform X1 n=2 Tax=Coffea arabica TaxID=13443 RepID=A0A6P6VAA6_COFAR|nr:pentatricopeptide repeat-containing protein At1g02370, mitochondrial-like isoform X1 [Coffea arabica]XP_027118572.1 pentatricopeptide repeat-containing protein At1g02370, mitochondrial-like isoform X1 [Coffea arabica]
MIKNAGLGQRKCAGIAAEALTRGVRTAVNVEKETINERNLYKRLSALGAKKGLVGATINEYLREGGVPHKQELMRCIKELRRFGRHHQALETMEWMDTRNVNLSHRDHATRLDLICKTQGIDAAEDYFNGLPPSAKNQFTYGALLNCYCVEKMKDKALDLFDKMHQMQIAPSSLAFNNLMSLYMRLGQPEKVPPLVDEMKKRKIPLSTFTYNIFMHSYSCLDDIEGVERVFEEIMQEAGKRYDWTTFSNLAVAYVNAGLNEKAVLALKKVEQEMGPRNREAFHYLLSLYARTANIGEVHRIWKSLRSSLPTVTNLSYLTMLQALNKLNDIHGLKNCFREWESTCSSYDIRLANLAIGAYLRHDMAEDAESVFHSALKRSSGPFFIAREMLMMYYLKNRSIRLALQCMEAAISELDGSEWQPKSDSICKFLTVCEEEKDVDSAEEFCKYLKKVNCLNHRVYKSLLQTYVAAAKTAPYMRTRIEGDGIEICSELENLLQNVSPE